MPSQETLSDHDWIVRFSARLHARWPTVLRVQRDETAAELALQPHWRCLEPEDAAVCWLRQGIPDHEDVPF
ncbi:hypothetical protein [Aquincola tertiaricarbonis]|uniref:hypothetical protein n=1 Tax=Aquincola tertiaricarbonis TaxID=391953 RepID=UPI000614D19D|nr:hypothetical protein [Aquincola tertiaricarbonis]